MAGAGACLADSSFTLGCGRRVLSAHADVKLCLLRGIGTMVPIHRYLAMQEYDEVKALYQVRVCVN